jgi:hypothetical protein
MLFITQYRKSLLVTVAVTACICFLARCGSDEKKVTESTTEATYSYADYVSADACKTCHSSIYESHIQSAHYLTGRPAVDKYIMGSFEKGKNTYSYSPSILLSMQKRDSGFFQVAYFKGEEKKAMKFDIVIGSGVMGQSYLTWRDNRLFQLPITFFTAANQWANSPGFPSEKVMIDRPVTARCLECHISYAEGFGGTELEPASFDKNKIIFGVDCQKCHGPAAKHVEYHTANPNEKIASHIVNPAKLSRQQQLDVCTLCHGGNIQKVKPSFEFTAGENLSEYFKIDSTANNMVPNSTSIDVHGNQAGLLQASKCYMLSADMTCSTCHNTHENQRGNAELFSKKCMNCHNTEDSKFKTATHTTAKAPEKNCINCHMPAQPSKSIALFLQDEETPRASLLRSHFIGIYTDEARKYLNQHTK